jgi:hypothetical protein
MDRILLALPPLSSIPRRTRAWVIRPSVLTLHAVILTVLYLLFFIAAAIEGTFLIPNGIGVFENPPFFGHVSGGVASVCLPYAMAKRVGAVGTTEADRKVLRSFANRVQNSKLKLATFHSAFLVGLFALAYTVSMSLQPGVDIYDAVSHPLTFSSYLLVRCYLYLIAYPFMLAGSFILIYYLFLTLQSSNITYRPFHFDGRGGFGKYYLAVDRPVYAIQSLTVLVAVMNFIGWGGIARAPILLSIGAPIVVTAFALLLLIAFNRIVVNKRREVIRELRQQQMNLYPAVKDLSSVGAKEALEFVERIEAMERLVAMIKKKRQGGWEKYFINLCVIVLTRVAEPIGALLSARILESMP